MTDYIGKKVKIIDRFGGHYFKIGSIVRIFEKDDYDEDYGQGYLAQYLDGNDYWYIYEDDDRTEFAVIGEI